MSMPGDEHPTLLAGWVALVGGWGADRAAVDAAGKGLLERYREPWRAYHGPAHVAAVLAVVDDLVETSPALAPATAVRLAVWFHDAVYDPRAPAGANEAASAELCAAVLGPLGAPPPLIAEAARLVRVTATHAVAPRDAGAAVLVDADLSILGTCRDRYRRYAAQIRQEYGWLDEAVWRRGRSAVLGAFLGRPRLFVTDAGFARFERVARSNLAWELAALAGGEPEPGGS